MVLVIQCPSNVTVLKLFHQGIKILVSLCNGYEESYRELGMLQPRSQGPLSSSRKREDPGNEVGYALLNVMPPALVVP